MIHDVKVFKPDKNGKLVEVSTITSTDASNIHWSNFKTDINRIPLKDPNKIHPKYQHGGIELKECAEKGCTTQVSDPRRKTCSKKCSDMRVHRKQMLAKNRRKKKKTKFICKHCGKPYMSARKNSVYCIPGCHKTTLTKG